MSSSFRFPMAPSLNSMLGRYSRIGTINNQIEMVAQDQVERDLTPPNEELYHIEETQNQARLLPLGSAQRLSAFVGSWLIWMIYMYFRFQQSRPLRKLPASLSWPSWGLLYCEIVLALPDIQSSIELALSLLPSKTQSARPVYKLSGKSAPMVHILITVCGEKLDVIWDTINAASSQDYPSHCYRVFVLDDAGDSQLSDLIEAWNRKQPMECIPVTYLARSKLPNVQHYYKAGNLRYGLETTENLYGGSEFFAALDADMIPERDWLSRTVPHLIYSPDHAMFGPPQLSYNIPVNDPLSQDSNVFAHVLEPVHDRFGASQCSGSGYVMRRSALESIGGWPLANVGEDIVCSYLLAKEGWKIGFIEDQLQYGLAPSSLQAYIMQRMRWTDGSLLVAKKFKFFLPFFDRAGKRSFIQRTFAMLHAFKAYLSAFSFMAMLFLPLCFLFLGINHRSEARLDRSTVRVWFLLLWLSRKLFSICIYGHLGMGNYSNMKYNRRWIAPFNVFCIARSLFSNTERTKFVVTGSFVSTANERSANNRQSLPRRMLNPIILMYLGYSLTLFAIFLFWSRPFITYAVNGKKWSYQYTAAILYLVEFTKAAFVPVRYMLFPPTVPERRQLLEKDEYGVFRPKRKGWVRRDGSLVSRSDAAALVWIIIVDWLRPLHS